MLKNNLHIVCVSYRKQLLIVINLKMDYATHNFYEWIYSNIKIENLGKIVVITNGFGRRVTNDNSQKHISAIAIILSLIRPWNAWYCLLN